MPKSDEELIEEVALDYFEGWFTGDVTRMDRALHPDLVKRWPGNDGAASLGITTKERMLELTAQSEGKDDVGDGTLDVTILDIYQDIASVAVCAGVYQEYLHLVRTSEGWKIANALWRLR
jgi:predicted metal-dependent HD superfamily phosphohydrolase